MAVFGAWPQVNRVNKYLKKHTKMVIWEYLCIVPNWVADCWGRWKAQGLFHPPLGRLCPPFGDVPPLLVEGEFSHGAKNHMVDREFSLRPWKHRVDGEFSQVPETACSPGSISLHLSSSFQCKHTIFFQDSCFKLHFFVKIGLRPNYIRCFCGRCKKYCRAAYLTWAHAQGVGRPNQVRGSSVFQGHKLLFTSFFRHSESRYYKKVQSQVWWMIYITNETAMSASMKYRIYEYFHQCSSNTLVVMAIAVVVALVVLCILHILGALRFPVAGEHFFAYIWQMCRALVILFV